MSASAAAAAAASAQSAAASAQALAALDAAHRAECVASMRGYQHEGATVAEMRSYAGCVVRVHGDGAPMPDGMAVFIKIAIVLLLASIPVGGWCGLRQGDWGDVVLGALMAPCLVAAGILALALVVAGVLFVVGG